MNILVINAGSSSLKYQLIDMEKEMVLLKGICERIGIGGKVYSRTFDGRELEKEVDLKDHRAAFKFLADLLVDEKSGVIKSLDEIFAIGHRIVHGADRFKSSVIIDSDALKNIEELCCLAPLHNHASAQAIRACFETFGEKVKEVAVFDTSFHQTIKEEAFLYGLPYEFYEKYRVRKYGFHGTSHRYVAGRTSELLKIPLENLKLVSCHLGNGSSLCAIEGGKSVDTTMGLTPLDGLLMGTRCGNIDPSCITFLMDELNIGSREISKILNEKSGLLGVSGVSSDFRDIRKAAAEGNVRAGIAAKMLAYQVRKNIASCVAVMDGVDCIVFTGGIGENSVNLIYSICSNLNFLGVCCSKQLVEEKSFGSEGLISTPDSKIDVLIVPTNEELMIAKDAVSLVSKD